MGSDAARVFGGAVTPARRLLEGEGGWRRVGCRLLMTWAAAAPVATPAAAAASCFACRRGIDEDDARCAQACRGVDPRCAPGSCGRDRKGFRQLCDFH
eukprot:363378-Chlamydomonas_euryale.AAC.42